jgi:hypothetical protein
MEKIYIHCDTISQFKALREIQHSFLPEGVLNLELIEDGIRLTDQTGATANFIYVPESDMVILSQ